MAEDALHPLPGTAHQSTEPPLWRKIPCHDDEEPAVEAIAAENPESQAATLPGDFRLLPASAFCETKIEQETSEFSTAPTDAASEILRAEDADSAVLEMDMPVDPSPVFVSWPAE